VPVAGSADGAAVLVLMLPLLYLFLFLKLTVCSCTLHKVHSLGRGTALKADEKAKKDNQYNDTSL
jgi:hypothetical protein